ncbi:MAG TPA: hypothetical protein VE954_02110 [Oligoflexus sp.]|uniref:hypothetical protein n=1 Tax=Oligoflexus sp. TaxID=1971216 RepID=UPI002D5FF1A0|nr:hypothetical protein [Oligoflexus sp.]HYX31880.1 hypothetical protein [Oligoflexus sp.]
MLDRIVREHSYAMNAKVEPKPLAPEPELILDYDVVRVRLPNRAAKLRRRQEMAEKARKAAEEKVMIGLQRLAAQEEETARQKAANSWRLAGLRRRQAVFDYLQGRELPRVDASDVSLKKLLADIEIEREESVASELLDEYRSKLAGHEVFPVFSGMRLYVDGRWGWVIGINLECCAMTMRGTKGQTDVDWDRALRCFDAGSGTADAGRDDDNLVKKLRFEHKNIWPEDWDFPFVTGARLCVKGRWGVILKTKVKRAIILLDGQKKARDYFWEPILKEQKKLLEMGFQGSNLNCESVEI